ncbi:uncharacterized protein C8Q71DRAFT_892487 [Rhodofomes roseus]|uniref:DUF4124 domain-containing protein n=1 Tax=Rhodofomes roseus TaxID=34475 RepID=A0ABQ8KPT7_9APHY|nr:uncharacterized protein C8Q71DRAFT_892487 [Rhodofomes roseus]KAH9839872.1 hypothetical protein C8Q71DRAFT_892487 [Rhodofomes roseus]
MHNPWAGHPYPAEYWRSFRHHRRGGPRILWFLIGAGTATWWFKSHQAHEWKTRHCWRDRIPQDAYPMPSGAPPAAYNASQAEEQKREYGKRWGWSWSSKDGHKSWQSPPPAQEISELSEATLDSVLATVQSLKVKLAEARTQREQHLQQMQALKDEQYKMFEQWRKQHEEQQKQQQQAAQQQPPKPRYPVDFTSA